MPRKKGSGKAGSRAGSGPTARGKAAGARVKDLQAKNARAVRGGRDIVIVKDKDKPSTGL